MIAIKTLIELFDSCQIENIIAGLRFMPEKIVFVGFKGVMTKKRQSDMRKFLEVRKANIVTDFQLVERYNYENIYNKLNYIIDTNPDCCFDLTGGKELVLAAMGAVSATRSIPMFQFNVRSGNFIRVSNCENIPDTEKTAMTISESVILNGGSVIYNDDADFKWDMTCDFQKDIEIMWKICKKNCGLWNRQANVFEGFEKYGKIDEDLKVTVNLEHMKNCKHDAYLSVSIIKSLINSNLITGYKNDVDSLSFKYKNEQVHQCLTKAGNILELYVYKTAREIAAQDPTYYDDIDVGIIVDWDGVIHDGTTRDCDTRNEIDVILMRDLIPIFISCKNGEVHKEALYELQTVAERFGGEYAKKILLSTYVSSDSEKKRYIAQRAHDMNIDLVDGVEKMSKEEFTEVLKKHAR